MAKYTRIAYALLLAIAFSSCSKEAAIQEAVAAASKIEPVLISNIYAGREAPVDHSLNSKHGHQKEQVYYTKFNFKTGREVEGNDWDIAFSTTKIIVNGGSKVNEADTMEPGRTGEGALCLLQRPFGLISAGDISEECFRQDKEKNYALPARSDEGWYHYTGRIGPRTNHHLIYPIERRTLLIKTHDGKGYVKMKILSYYKNAEPPSQNMDRARYYTFQYAYVPVKK